MTGAGPVVASYRDALEHLPLAELVLELELEDVLAVPFPGAFLRGVLGNRLRRGCPSRSRDGRCRPGTCAWCDLFSPVASPGREEHWSGDLRTIPVPYAVRSTGEEWQGGRVGILLLGRATAHAARVVDAFREAGERGLGRSRVRAILLEACSRVTAAGREVARAEAEAGDRPVLFRALSPLRLKEGGRWSRHPSPRLLAVAAARRASALCFHHGAGEALPPPGREWLSALEGVAPAREDWTWQEGTRWSARQRRRYPVGGVLGEMELSDPDPALRFFLAVAAVLGVGKGTAYGLGRCSLERP